MSLLNNIVGSFRAWLSTRFSRNVNDEQHFDPNTSPEFLWWAEVWQYVHTYVAYVEHQFAREFISLQNVEQRLLSRNITTRSGPGVRRVRVAAFPAAGQQVFAKLNNHWPRPLCRGDIISLWMGPSYPTSQTWIQIVGQIIRYEKFWTNHATVEVLAFYEHRELQIFLTFRDGDLLGSDAMESPAWKQHLLRAPAPYIESPEGFQPAPLPPPPRRQVS